MNIKNHLATVADIAIASGTLAGSNCVLILIHITPTIPGWTFLGLAFASSLDCLPSWRQCARAKRFPSSVLLYSPPLYVVPQSVNLIPGYPVAFVAWLICCILAILHWSILSTNLWIKASKQHLHLPKMDQLNDRCSTFLRIESRRAHDHDHGDRCGLLSSKVITFQRHRKWYEM